MIVPSVLLVSTYSPLSTALQLQRASTRTLPGTTISKCFFIPILSIFSIFPFLLLLIHLFSIFHFSFCFIYLSFLLFSSQIALRYHYIPPYYEYLLKVSDTNSNWLHIRIAVSLLCLLLCLLLCAWLHLTLLLGSASALSHRGPFRRPLVFPSHRLLSLHKLTYSPNTLTDIAAYTLYLSAFVVLSAVVKPSLFLCTTHNTGHTDSSISSQSSSEVHLYSWVYPTHITPSTHVRFMNCYNHS